MPDIKLLDGAMGSEFINRGLKLPEHIWSSWVNLEAHEKVYSLHKDYINAGADYITTNTFRTTPRSYRKIGLSENESRALAKTSLKPAVSIANEVVSENVKVLGSIAPLEDCYRPDLFPGLNDAKKEFSEILKWLYDSGIDIFLLETMNSIEETVCCLDLAKKYNIPIWVSFVLLDNKHILSGESLNNAIQAIKDYEVKCLLINCNPLNKTLETLEIIENKWNKKWGIYPNLGLGEPSPDGVIENISEDKEFTNLINHAILSGVNIIGGCCGSRPRHIRLIKEYIENLNSSI